MQRGAGGEIPGQPDSEAPARLPRSSKPAREDEEVRTDSGKLNPA